MHGTNIKKINTLHLYQHYSLFMHNKLEYTWRGDYYERVPPGQLHVLTWSSSSVPPGTTSTIHPPSSRRRIQQTAVRKYSLVFDKGKFTPAHGMKAHEESRIMAPLTLTVALETFITSHKKTLFVRRHLEKWWGCDISVYTRERERTYNLYLSNNFFEEAN